jgi:hypothetical protein
MSSDDTRHLCDACGSPIIGEHFTDDAVCHGHDVPGFFLCGEDECKARRPKSLRARRQFYVFQREWNKEQHSYTADSPIAFHIEMHTITEDEAFSLGGLLGMTTEDFSALPKSKVEKLIQDALADWVGNHVESSWSVG